MDSSTDTASQEQAVARIFNSSIAAAAIGAAWEVGLLDQLREQKKLDVQGFATQHDLDSRSTSGLVMALAVVDVVRREPGTNTIIVPGGLLDEALRTASLFHWLALGSGGLFSRMHCILRKDRTYQRDSAAVAFASRGANMTFFDPIFFAAMDRHQSEFHSVVDLGSGSGERLMKTLERYPGTTGLGVDIAAPAIEVAEAESAKRGLGHRLSFTIGDVCDLTYREEFANVDLVTCFLMGHDFWPRDNCVATLQQISRAFPRARRFFLGDTTRILLDDPTGRHAVTEHNVPIFTLGFEFGHALMGASLPTIDDWEGVFAEGGWRSVDRHLVQPPSLSVIFELERA